MHEQQLQRFQHPVMRFVATGFAAVRFLSVVLAMFSLSFVVSAEEGEGVEWMSTEWLEQGDAWRLELTVRLPKPPDTPEVPLRFEFVPTAYYERSLVDGGGTVERRIPLQARQSLVEALDVRFIDEQSGQLSQRAKLRFVLSRGRGFEAGEYAVLVRDARSGEALAGLQTLTLQGRNPIIDRRSIAFGGANAPKRKPLPKVPEREPLPKVNPTRPTTEEPEEAPIHSGAAPSRDSATLSASVSTATAGGSPPAGSCACEVAPSQFSLLAMVPWLGAGLLFHRRRQRRAKRRAPRIL